MKITQFLHAALLVSDLARSQHFYGEILGLPMVDRPLKFPGIWYQVGTFQIHLIASDTIFPDIVDPQKWGRNRHLAFAVADVEVAKTQLLEAGYPVQMSASGRPALFTQDPDGNVIELGQI